MPLYRCMKKRSAPEGIGNWVQSLSSLGYTPKRCHLKTPRLGEGTKKESIGQAGDRSMSNTPCHNASIRASTLSNCDLSQFPEEDGVEPGPL